MGNRAQIALSSTIRPGIVPGHTEAYHEHAILPTQRSNRYLPEQADNDAPAHSCAVVKDTTAHVSNSMTFRIMLFLSVLLAQREDEIIVINHIVAGSVLPLQDAVNSHCTKFWCPGSSMCKLQKDVR